MSVLVRGRDRVTHQATHQSATTDIGSDGYTVPDGYVGRAIWCADDGDIKLVTEQGATVTFVGILGGTMLEPGPFVSIFAADTTVASAVILYGSAL